jgi:hypothetical protein
MGAPTSSILLEFYLQHLENTKIFNIRCSSKVVGYFRYVNDILIVYNQNNTDIEEVQNAFNNITLNLKLHSGTETDKLS